MVQQETDFFRGPGSPAGRARISSGKECPGAPVKAPRPDDEPLRHDPLWQMDYLAHNNPSAARSPRRPIQGRNLFAAFEDNDQRNAEAHQLVEDDEADESRNGGVERPNGQHQRQRPVARSGVAVVSPVRDVAASN